MSTSIKKGELYADIAIGDDIRKYYILDAVRSVLAAPKIDRMETDLSVSRVTDPTRKKSSLKKGHTDTFRVRVDLTPLIPSYMEALLSRFPEVNQKNSDLVKGLKFFLGNACSISYEENYIYTKDGQDINAIKSEIRKNFISGAFSKFSFFNASSEKIFNKAAEVVINYLHQQNLDVLKSIKTQYNSTTLKKSADSISEVNVDFAEAYETFQRETLYLEDQILILQGQLSLARVKKDLLRSSFGAEINEFANDLSTELTSLQNPQ